MQPEAKAPDLTVDMRSTGLNHIAFDVGPAIEGSEDGLRGFLTELNRQAKHAHPKYQRDRKHFAPSIACALRFRAPNFSAALRMFHSTHQRFDFMLNSFHPAFSASISFQLVFVPPPLDAVAAGCSCFHSTSHPFIETVSCDFRARRPSV